MFFRGAALLFIAAIVLWPAGKKTVGTARGENEDLIVTATIYTTPDDVKELLGNDLEGHFVVVEVKVEPKYGKEANVDRDDFTLRNLETAEKSTPFAPAQIAGRAALVVKHNEDDTKTSHKPTFSGGIGGLGTGSGSSSGGGGYGSAKMQNADEPKDAALEKLLIDKQLPDKKSDQPVSGLLYFAFEKVKMKDLQLDYGQKPNRMSLKFKESK